MKKLLYISTLFLLLFNLSAENSDDVFDVMNVYKVTSTFGDSRYDHFHTGLDLAANDQEIRAITNSELIFHNKKRSNSISYGMGDFAVFENSYDKLRFNYSHLKEDSFIPENVYWKKNDKIASVGSSGHSTGSHLHFEVEDIENKRLLNPLAYIGKKDTLPPRIEDVYFITKDNEKISLTTNAKLKRGGKLFIKCMDRIDDSNYFIAPYKITVIIDGKEKSVLTFDYFRKTESAYVVSDTKLKFEDIYINKEDFDFFLLDFYSLPNLVGLKIIVEDFHGNKIEFKKPIRILPPETK